MSQTSEYAMQYSRSAQEEMGQWVLFLTTLSVVVGAMAWWTSLSAKKVRAATDAAQDGPHA